LLLGLSGSTEDDSVELGAVAGSEHGDSGIAHGALLSRFAEQVHSGDGLAEIRADPDLQTTPVVVLTTSSDDADVLSDYRLGANAFNTKPVALDGWLRVISTINDFWLSVVRLPPR